MFSKYTFLPQKFFVFVIIFSLITIGLATNTTPAHAQGGTPYVTGNYPTDGATGVGVGQTIYVTFNAPVSLSLSSFSLTCGGSDQQFNVYPDYSEGFFYVTIQPVLPLPYGSVCTFTVKASGISDFNNQYMAADFVVTFTTEEMAPALASSIPPANAVNVDPAAPLSLTFTEPVQFNRIPRLFCNGDVLYPFILTGGPTTFTLTPYAELLEKANCSILLEASDVSDLDTDDPADTMANLLRIDFATADKAPRVASISPAKYSYNVPKNESIAITFSEPIIAATQFSLEQDAFRLICNGINQPFTLSGGPTTYTLNPNADLPAAAQCEVSVKAVTIADVDAVAPEIMLTNYFSSFVTADSAPTVTSTTPANETGDVAANADLSVTFSKFVLLDDNALQLTCDNTPQAFIRMGGPRTYTLNPANDLPTGAPCRLSIIGSEVYTLYGLTMLETLNIDFRIADAAPTVLNTVPVNGAASFSPASNLTVTFSEPVMLGSDALSLTCNEVVQTMRVTGGPTTFTLNPDADLPLRSVCQLTVTAAYVTDEDRLDGPDAMLTDVTVVFSTTRTDTVAVFRPANKTAYLRYGNTAGAHNWAFAFSQYLPGDVVVYGDWNGDGITSLGMFRPSTNTWYLKNGNGAGSPVAVQLVFGLPGDIPVVGDWDGNGTDTIGIFRPTAKKFFLRNTNSAGTPDLSVAFGLNGDKPVAGDWDGNHTDTVGTWRTSNRTFFITNAASGTGAIANTIAFGLAGDIPLAGDWDGDGIDSVGTFRPSAKTFYLRTSLAQSDFISVAFGLTPDVPMIGTWETPPTLPIAPSFTPKN